MHLCVSKIHIDIQIRTQTTHKNLLDSYNFCNLQVLASWDKIVPMRKKVKVRRSALHPYPETLN